MLSGNSQIGSDLSRAQADARYIRRFVDIAGISTLAGETISRLNGGGVTEPILRAVTVAEANMPADAAINGQWETGDAARLYGGLKIFRAGTNPLVRFVRVNGTLAAPTAVLANDVLGAVEFTPWPSVGGFVGRNTSLVAIATEDQTGIARGSRLELRYTPTGSVTLTNGLVLRGTPTITYWAASTTTLRVLPVSSGQLRDPSDTVARVEWNAVGLGFFGVAPVARPTIAGSRLANPALADLLTKGAALGLWIDGTIV